MIFYEALDENGKKQLRGTQADARAVNRDFTQIDIPTDKPRLMAFVQKLYDQLAHADVVCEMQSEALGKVASTCDDEGHSPNEHGQCDDCRAWVAEPAPKPRTTDDVEDLWPNLPIAFRFHLCSLTMEEARATDWNGTKPEKAPQRYTK